MLIKQKDFDFIFQLLLSQLCWSPLSFPSKTQVSMKTSLEGHVFSAAVGHMRSSVWSCAYALTRGLCLAPVDKEGRVCMDHLLWQNHAHTPVTLAQLGKVSRSNMALPQLLMASVIQRMPMMFMTIPVLAWGKGKAICDVKATVGLGNNCFLNKHWYESSSLSLA